MALKERVENDYDNWTQSGDQDWVLSDSNSKAQQTSDESDASFTGVIQKSFELTGRVQAATLTVRGKLSAVEVSIWIPGIAQAIVKLKDADGVWHKLYDGSGGDAAAMYFLNELDISSYLSKAGTYILRFIATVRSSSSSSGGAWSTSYVQFMLASLMASYAIDWDLTFDEPAGATEKFVSGMSFNEPAKVVEHFNIVKTTPAVTEQERLIAGIDNNDVLIFDTGTPAGRFDTDDEDYGYPGMDKTLDEVQFESSAESPHTITVYASTDSGLTWVLLGTVVAQRGKTCSVFACITAVKHSISFRGDGLYLSSYVMYAIPRGRMPKQ